jgi:hypothetical protein
VHEGMGFGQLRREAEAEGELLTAQRGEVGTSA